MENNDGIKSDDIKVVKKRTTKKTTSSSVDDVSKKKTTTKKRTTATKRKTTVKKEEKTSLEHKKRPSKKKTIEESVIAPIKENEEKSVAFEVDSQEKTLNDVIDEVKLESKLVKKEKLEFNLLEVIIIIIITIVFVSVLTGFIVYNNYDKFNRNSSSVLKDELKEIEDNYYSIMEEYVGEVDGSELVDAAINGMYNYLGDAYSIYIDKDSNDSLQDTLSGEYEGIGVEITTSYSNDGTYKTYISKVFSDTPASRAGLKEGDIFVSLNGVDLSDKNSSYVADTIKNGAQTNNTITINRDGKELTFDIKREHVVINSVSSEVKNGVGYIKIDTFSLTTADLVKKEIDKFDSSIKSLVIDLRDNGGGYTISAYDTANLFIEKDKNIYQYKDKNGLVTNYKADTGVYRNFDKIAVLINGESASSAEILALALKESASAKVVGVKSFGKGTVQETKQLSSGAMVKYTIGYWLSPNGNSINNVGVVPDIIEENVENQVTKAIEAVK